MSTPVRLRERAAIAAEIGALAAARSLPQEFRSGARAALEWVTKGGPGPLTGTLTAPPPTMRAVVGELSAAEAIIYGRPSPLRDFAVGVEHGLLWAELATPTPPSVRTMPAGEAGATTVIHKSQSEAGHGHGGGASGDRADERLPDGPPAR